MDKHLHIITHDKPWPTGHGGLMDIGYKIKALHQAGVKIHLHVFCKFIKHEPILNNWCKEVYYYKRSVFSWLAHPCLPFIVASRLNKTLIKRLKQDNYPVLFEGTHTSYPLLSGLNPDRKTALRLHNIEHTYYHKLAQTENHIIKKWYYLIESWLLKKYENKIFSKATVLWTVSDKDSKKLQNKYSSTRIQHLPIFLPWNQIKSECGKGCYCLYHGNLSVSENAFAAKWLLENIFSQLKIPLVIAGKNPPHWLKKLAHQQTHTCLVANPNDHEMDDLIRKAQLHILPSFNDTGVKLKLLHVLFEGRFCLVNSPAVAGSGTDELCIQFDNEKDCREKLQLYFDADFSEGDKIKRTAILQQLYLKEKSLDTILTWLS